MRQRSQLTHDAWVQMASRSSLPLLALWADTREVLALFREDNAPIVVSTEIEDGAYPALSPFRPAAAWFERIVKDLWGHVATGGIDQRPWLDHGRWPHAAPMAPRSAPASSAEPPEFPLMAELDQLPLGPVRGGMSSAAHLRLGLHGETIQRLEMRLGYTHKGTLALIRGKSPRAAARFAARLAGEATVAHSSAFARAAEDALDCAAPPRAVALRAVMGELERITGSLDTLAAAAETIECDALATRFAWHGEAIRRASDIAFGHRLMMDCVVPGGLAVDIAAGGREAIGRALSDIEPEIPELRRDVGRLTRLAPLYERLAVILDSGHRATGLLDTLPEGAIAVPLPTGSGEGLGCADGPGGEIWHWLSLDHGQIASVFLCDPAWAKLPRLEAMMAGRQVEDLPLVMASLGLSSSGMDL